MRYRADYQTAIRTLAHPAVRFIGHQPDPAPCYENADLLIVPSNEPDPYPTVTLEEMAHGLAVIATDCSGLGEQVVDGETGRLVPLRNGNVMAEAMRQLISNPAAATGIGAAGRLHFSKIANLKQQAKQLIQVLTAR